MSMSRVPANGCFLTPSLSETWDFALFRVNFFFEENDGTLELKFHQTQVNLWKNVPRSPMATANSQFLVLSSDYADPTHGQIRIYDLNSSRSCAIREVSCKFIVNL